MRHAGMGWSNGPITGGNGRILSLPSPDLLMLGSEHWHYDEAVRAGKRVLFRGMARQGFRPAELGWDAKRYVDEVTRDAVKVSEPITDFIGWNELNLQDERGDQRPDHGDLTALFVLLGAFMEAVLLELRRRPVTKDARLHFGAWAPKDETDYTEHWRRAAEMADVMDVHAYGPGPGIVGHIDKYRGLFPGKPIELTEWHSNEDGVESDRDTLAMLSNYAAVHQDFRAYYFLYRWFDPPAHQRQLAEAIAVEGSAERQVLFRSPPVIEAPEPEPIPEPIPEPEPPMPEPPRGVDVASYQGYPDWAAVAAAGYTFAITKATEDTGYVNPTFAHNWAGIKNAGLYRGAYHFARPSINDAVSEADYFVGLVEQHGIETGDILALDLEAGVGDLGPWVLAFCRRIEERCGFPPIIYTGAWFSGPHNLAAYPEIGNYGLWLAAYQAQMPAPPPPWGTVAFWQYSSSGHVPGIAGDVDVNVFNGPAGRIALYGKPAPAEPVPDPSAWVVGPGILAAMAAHGDQPASDEVYAAPDRAWSEAFGQSGSRYVWVPSLGRVTRFDPAA